MDSMSAQLDCLSSCSATQADMLDCLRAAVRHLEALEMRRTPSTAASEPLIDRQSEVEAPAEEARASERAEAFRLETAALGVHEDASLLVHSERPETDKMPENIVTQAAVFVCELHELAVAALETRGIDGLLPLAESLCTVQLGHAQEMIAIRALGRGVERALDRWQLDEVVGREDELWRLGRALAHLPSRLQLEVIRSLGTSSDALFLFQLCVASRDGWSQAHAQASESLASHWLALHNAWLAEEVMHRDDFNEGVQLGLFEDYEFWEPPEIEAAIRRWHTLAPSSAQAVPAACAEMHPDPRVFAGPG